MSMKMTISIDEESYKKAKEYAKKTGRTMSGLIQFCLAKEISENKMGDEKIWKEEKQSSSE